MAGELKNYPVTQVDGRPVPKGTTLRLNDEDAERMGLKKPSRRSQSSDEEPESDVVTSRRAGARSSKRAAPRAGK